MKKKPTALLLAMIMMLSLLAGCTGGPNVPSQGAGSQASSSPAGDEPLKVALMLNGTLGDLAFFDSAANGMKLAQEQYGIESKVFEAGFDRTKWEPTLYDIAEEDWDVIITGTFDMVEMVTKVAQEFPDKKFIHYDASLDYSAAKLDNAYSMDYLYNQGAFLGGYVAASISKTGNVGAIGAMSIPAVNDYLIGYIAGARYKNPDIKIQAKYTNDFNDSALGMELAAMMYNSGADVVANGASIAGLGIMDAAKDKKGFVIGSDSDQAMLFEESDPEKAATIVTSVMKRIDMSLLRAIGKYIDGTLPFGTNESLGMAESCIELADNKYYQEYVPETVRNEVKALAAKILSGEVEAPSAFGMTGEDIDAYLKG